MRYYIILRVGGRSPPVFFGVDESTTERLPIIKEGPGDSGSYYIYSEVTKETHDTIKSEMSGSLS